MQVAVLRISYRSAEEVSSGFFLLPVEIFPRRSCNDTGQGQQGNDVRDGHETVENIGDVPYSLNGKVRTDENCCDIEPAENNGRDLV